MVPASDQLYATAYLDPGADQKINLRDLLQRFPALQGKNPVDKVDEGLEQGVLGLLGLGAVVAVQAHGVLVVVACRAHGRPRARLLFPRARSDRWRRSDSWRLSR